jgi:hypothetical protein
MADYEIALAVALSAVTLFIFLASILLDEKHWQLKMGLFYGALALGWTTVYTALILVQSVVPGSILETSVTTAYYAYTVIGVLCIIYIAIRMFAYALGMLLNLAKPKNAEGDMQSQEEAW